MCEWGTQPWHLPWAVTSTCSRGFCTFYLHACRVESGAGCGLLVVDGTDVGEGFLQWVRSLECAVMCCGV